MLPYLRILVNVQRNRTTLKVSINLSMTFGYCTLFSIIPQSAVIVNIIRSAGIQHSLYYQR